MKISRLFATLLIVLPGVAGAWWSNDWKQRTVVTLNTSSVGAAVQESLSDMAIPVRLHSGNFDFVGAKPDGSDLRVIAGDDKTPLKFWIERIDGVNELAVLWVQVPSLLAGTDKNTIYVYGGNDKAAVDSDASAAQTAVADGATLAAFHFADKDGVVSDQTGSLKAGGVTAIEPNGLIGPSARLNVTPIVIPASNKLDVAADAPFTVALWVRPDAAAGTLFAEGPLSVLLTGGKLAAKLGSTVVNGGDVAAATWSQIVLTSSGGKLTLYLNGVVAGQGDVPRPSPALAGEVRLGEGYRGLVDEVDIAGTSRSADWIKVNYAAQSADAKLVASKTETAGSEGGGGSTGYFGVLIKSLTPDAWTIIVILGGMLLTALLVMITKTQYVRRTDSANQQFLERFRTVKNVLKLDSEKSATETRLSFEDSSLYRLYSAGVRELAKREVGVAKKPLSGPALAAVRATIDADSVREGYRLNSQMVLLTIAIAGGPFLGLLGTVLGVMITFASIAAAGDVNVNAIAPGIAAALLATVAGLGVAIPSLFGYNYLASRIKTISSDMQIFVDEFVTRVAETYGVQ